MWLGRNDDELPFATGEKIFTSKVEFIVIPLEAENQTKYFPKSYYIMFFGSVFAVMRFGLKRWF